MESRNQTSVTEFIFLGLIRDPKLQIPLFVFFLLVYIITLLGNIGIILVTRLDARLQTPMYFFLFHLSILDISYSSDITPKTLQTLLAEQKIISILGCAVQMYLFVAFATTELYLLAVMAYDRYVAICNPLLYPVIMTRSLCTQIMCAVYIIGFCNAVIHTVCTFQLSYCGSNVINHFYCDILPILALSCSDTSVNEIIVLFFAGFHIITTFLAILISYTYIITNILRIRSAEGRRKTFNTCASHFTAVFIFFGTLFVTYAQPNSSYSMEQDKVVSVFYAVLIPMLNPLIYSLRNKEVKAALIRIWKKFLTIFRGFTK
ncbi:olfactory receptor 5B21-like [Microcaecilia unicolor]|uniref:Olfactory receptor n=1 Tax=Microcaecilia unicolor TaxID=1415580 RepID=A0A6P7X1H0_9AMPH|nr:olfactory receptor 5B21-like [Microcaecilia unicolor]